MGASSALQPPGMIPFQAQALARASCAYLNDQLLTQDEALRSYGFAVPSELELESDFGDPLATFWAERYGGPAIGINGGAGRCGTKGRFQVKGIGRTPLIGEGVGKFDFWHSHGGIALVDAMQEAIWGEVFAQALPYGAARIAALLLTGTNCWYEGPDGKKTQARRALVVRESTIRPAHFMRAIYFRPQPSLELESDTARVRAAVSLLTQYLPRGAGGGGTAQEEELLNRGLVELSSRLAFQCATAQTKRLLHGAISASNIALDGRWVDFGTATSLPTYANSKSFGSPTRFATLWDEHRRIEPILELLCFYINKYFPFENRPAQVSLNALRQHFSNAYAESLRLATIGLLGLPATLLQPYWLARDVRVLGDALIDVMRAGNERRVESAVLDLSVFGHNNVGHVITTLAAQPDPARCDALLKPLVPQHAARRVLVQSFNNVLQLLGDRAANAGLTKVALRKLCTIGGVKATKPFTQLHRPNMAASNRQVIAENAAVKDLEGAVHERIVGMSHLASVMYAPSTCAVATLWRDPQTHVYYHPRKDKWLRERGGSTTEHEALACVEAMAPDLRRHWSDLIDPLHHVGQA